MLMKRLWTTQNVTTKNDTTFRSIVDFELQRASHSVSESFLLTPLLPTSSKICLKQTDVTRSRSPLRRRDVSCKGNQMTEHKASDSFRRVRLLYPRLLDTGGLLPLNIYRHADFIMNTHDYVLRNVGVGRSTPVFAFATLRHIYRSTLPRNEYMI